MKNVPLLICAAAAALTLWGCSKVNPIGPAEAPSRGETVRAADLHIGYQYLAEWGGLGTGQGKFDHPRDVAVDGTGNILVLDSTRIQKFDPAGNFIRSWGNISAAAMCVDQENRIYVAESGNKRIQVLLPSGGISIYGQGFGNATFLEPRAVAVDSAHNRMYVVDSWPQIVVVDLVTGNCLARWYSNQKNGLNLPSRIAVDKSGYVYVTDNDFASKQRVLKLSSSGVLLAAWGTPGTAAGQFNHPAGLAFDPNGSGFFVADTSNHRFQKFDLAGNFVAACGTLGTGAGQFKAPMGVAVDSAVYVYVADTYNHRIQKFRKRLLL